MAVIKLLTASIKKPRSVTGKLAVTFKKPRRLKYQPGELHTGAIEVKGFRLEDKNPVALGIACFVLNAKTVVAETPSFPDGSLKLAVRSNSNALLGALDLSDEVKHSEYYFLKIFKNALYQTFNSKSGVRSLTDWWNKDLFPPVLARIPKELQVNTRMELGFYDEQGHAITSKTYHERLARRQLMASFEEAMKNLAVSGPVDPSIAGIVINMAEVLHLKGESAANGDNADPVVMQGSAERAVRQLISKFGFDRMPLTYGEFHGLLDYCEILDFMQQPPLSLKAKNCDSEAPQMREAKIVSWGKHHPEQVAAIRLYCDSNIEGLAKLHKQEDTLTVQGKNYRDPELDDHA